MARTEKYFIGPKLLDDIRRVIGRVDDEPLPSTITRIPTRLQDVPRAGGGPGVRMATFTGAWSINTSKVVTLRGVTATLSAFNIFLDISTDCGSRNCAVARDGTATYLIAAQCG